ncbi:MAG: sigma 54-interacting transcriptional regulator [Desulfomonile tiedjei]|nr:sigma 54-interacting transcriptional regulator [Desulfomonile tiedjei]
MSDLFDSICTALPLIARFSCGFATVIDLSNSRRKTVDGDGNDSSEYLLSSYEGFEEAVKLRQPLLVPSKMNSGVFNLFLPIGDCFLIINNSGHVGLADKLKIIFEEAIPLIARVAGGEAVLFDRKGIRFFSVGPDGRESDKGVGQYTYMGKRAMELGRPVIGPSLLEDGALAVRIPITDNFGMGVNNVVSVKQKKQLAAISQQNQRRYTFSNIIGKSDSLLNCLQQAKQVAEKSSTVLVSGETGTGKELLVQSIHSASQRSGGPFVALNCGAIPSGLVESQLFGYEAGSFTGARKGGQRGLFEQANGGTLFLDEISEMNLELQSRLLRVLQERELVRIGGTKVISINVRVIASTNKDLWGMVASGGFRQDLYYRLSVIELRIPPLRDRIEDLPLLIRHFITEFRANFGTFVEDISEEALECLQCHPWPGNVRELRNCIERIMNLSTNKVIGIEDIPVIIRKQGEQEALEHREVQPRPISAEPLDAGQSFDNSRSWPLPQGSLLKGTTGAAERSVILEALEKSFYNRRKAARMLGISSTTLWRKMKKLAISTGE